MEENLTASKVLVDQKKTNDPPFSLIFKRNPGSKLLMPGWLPGRNCFIEEQACIYVEPSETIYRGPRDLSHFAASVDESEK